MGCGLEGVEEDVETYKVVLLVSPPHYEVKGMCYLNSSLQNTMNMKLGEN